MSSESVSRPGASWIRPGSLVFAGIVGMMAYIVGHNESFLLDLSDPEWQHIEPFKWWLLVHGLAGGCALLLVPLQFSDGLRARYTRVHHVVGWTYICGVLVLAPLGIYIQYREELSGVPRSFTIAAAVDAILLLSTTLMAVFFVLRRSFQQHRQWMTRSYAVALVFFEVRVISGLLGLDDSGIATSETIIWICVACSIPLADVVLQLQESWRPRRSAGA